MGSGFESGLLVNYNLLLSIQCCQIMEGAANQIELFTTFSWALGPFISNILTATLAAAALGVLHWKEN